MTQSKMTLNAESLKQKLAEKPRISYETFLLHVLKLRNDSWARMRDIVHLKKLVRTWLIEITELVEETSDEIDDQVRELRKVNESQDEKLDAVGEELTMQREKMDAVGEELAEQRQILQAILDKVREG